jgi:chromosome segregation protein
LSDIRDELGRQINRLQRQAESAVKYKSYKEDERQTRAQLLAMRWSEMDLELSQINQVIAEQELALEVVLTTQVQDDTGNEEKRILLVDLTDDFEKVQAQFYEIGGSLGRLEQNIQFQSQRSLQLDTDLQEVSMGMEEVAVSLQDDELALEGIEEQLMAIEPEAESVSELEEASQEVLVAAEEAMHTWQADWDKYNQDSAEPQRIAEVSKSSIQHAENSIARIAQRLERLQHELINLQIGEEAEEQLAMLDEQLEEKELQLEQQQQDAAQFQSTVESEREKQQQLSQQLSESRTQLQSAMGRKASLDALQQAALGTDSESGRWLQSNQIHQNKRLADQLSVESGWETAVETVLADQLQSVVVPSIDQFAERLTNLKQGQVTLLEEAGTHNITAETGSLASKVSGLNAHWLNNILCANDLPSALSQRSGLKPGQSIVTPEGIWIGPSWIRVKRAGEDQSGVLARKLELEELIVKEDDLDALVEELEVELESCSMRINSLEQQRDTAQREVNQATQSLSDHKSNINSQKVRLEQQVSRRNQLLGEIEEQKEHKELETEGLEEAKIQWQTALEDMERFSDERELLLEKRDVCREALDQARHRARHQKDHAHQQQLKVQTFAHQKQSLIEAINRHQAQKQKLEERKTQLSEQLNEGDSPVEELKMQYEEMMQQRLDVEDLMKASRKKKETIENDIREVELKRQKLEQQAQGVRSQLEQTRMQYQTIHTRRGGIEEQLAEAEIVLEEIVATLAEDISIEACQHELEQIQQRITRLGAINLAAIDEFTTQSERKEYLDQQNEDLEKALETLENAIRKIDVETRTRFKETFDKVNSGLKELFPKVFGGGHAYLELTGDDLLDTGVAIMARPPGKKNSTIHLLSGGEKALTAIALVFSIFRLKPAPFCMLDEVDAPLDDANVGRYARLVEAMSEQVQFIYISHNKIAMEMAQQLMGVTMHEPGVSRIVSVNMEEAISLTD